MDSIILISFYCQEADNAQEFSLWMWMKEDSSRSVTVIDFDHDNIKETAQEFPGREVLSAIQIGSSHILGTRVSNLRFLSSVPISTELRVIKGLYCF